MATFVVRIQLQGADSSEYVPLWTALEKSGFADRVPSGEKWYALPSGVYVFSGERTLNEVTLLAVRAAQTTGRKPKVLVTQSAGMCCFGLDEYKTDDELLKELFQVKG